MFGTREGMGRHAQESPGSGDTMRFADGVTWRISQRGLVVCGPGDVPLLIEHACAADLPELRRQRIRVRRPRRLVGRQRSRPPSSSTTSSAEHLLADPSAPADPTHPADRRAGDLQPLGHRVHRHRHRRPRRPPRRLAGPAVLAWPRPHRRDPRPRERSSLFLGRPAGPQVSHHPWVDATVGLILGLALAGMHELAHAVTLVHYGRTPRSAGCGFYWGALCFYIDSSDGMTLPRKARIINALAGLAVDLVTASVLFTLSHAFAGVTLIAAVCWRIAVIQVIGVVENGLRKPSRPGWRPTARSASSVGSSSSRPAPGCGGWPQEISSRLSSAEI